MSLEPNFSLKEFFGQNDPAQETLQEYRKFWGSDDAFVLLLVEPVEGSLLTRQRIQALDDTRVLLEKSPEVRSVKSPTSIAMIESLSDGELDVQPVIDGMPDKDGNWSEWTAHLLANPFLVPALIDAEGRRGAIIVEFAGDTDDAVEVVRKVDHLRDLLEAREGIAGLSYITAGVPAVRRDFFHSFFGDIRVFGLIAFILASLILFSIFRSFYGVVIPLAAAGIPVLMVFGVMGVLGESIGVLNQAFFTLLPAIAIADAIHLISRYREEQVKMGGNGLAETPIKRALAHIGWTCLLTSVTTAIGFLSLQVASMPILHKFGTYAALGMIFGYVTVLFVVPVSLSFVKPTSGIQNDNRAWNRVEPLLGKVANVAIHSPIRVLLVTLIFVVGFIGFGTQVNLDNRLTSLLKDTHPTSQANLRVDDNLGGVLTLEFDMKIKPNDASMTITSPAILQAIDRLEETLNKEEAFRMCTSPATYIRSAHKAMMGERTIPESEEAISQLLLLMEGSDSIQNMLSLDRKRGRMIVRMRDIGGKAFEQVVQRSQNAVDEIFGDLPVTVSATGTPSVAYRGTNRITSDLRNSLSFAFIVIAFLIGILFKNVRIALICLVPNALPLLAGYGLMGAMGWYLQPSSALVFTVALGIAVDDTIHMMARYREGLVAGMSNQEAIHNAVIRCGNAVLITSLVLCVGFGVNMLSAFQQMTVLGALGTIVIFAALLCDVFVLPALLSLFGQNDREKVSTVSTGEIQTNG